MAKRKSNTVVEPVAGGPVNPKTSKRQRKWIIQWIDPTPAGTTLYTDWGGTGEALVFTSPRAAEKFIRDYILKFNYAGRFRIAGIAREFEATAQTQTVTKMTLC